MMNLGFFCQILMEWKNALLVPSKPLCDFGSVRVEVDLEDDVFRNGGFVLQNVVGVESAEISAL